MIEVKDLTKRYGDHVAVDRVSFKINNGRIYGFLGPNGAGKSTTMNMMTGCLAPTSGSVRINGFDIFDEPLKAKRCIGYLPEIPPLYEDMTPYEYLSFIADAKDVPYGRAQRQVHEVMELTRIEDVKDRLIKHLSKGYRQRVGIAQTMLGNPDIIILDEPTVGLDPKQITEIRALIRRLGEKKTVIISSHILAEISAVCDHVLILSEGRLIANAPIEELQSGFSDRSRLHLSVRGDEAGVLEALSEIEEVEDCLIGHTCEDGVVDLTLTVSGKDDLRDRIFFSLADHRYALLSMEREEATLESIFLSLTDRETKALNQPKKSKIKLIPDADERDGDYEVIDVKKERGKR